jgi:hypothetical protein
MADVIEHLGYLLFLRKFFFIRNYSHFKVIYPINRLEVKRFALTKEIGELSALNIQFTACAQDLRVSPS